MPLHSLVKFMIQLALWKVPSTFHPVYTQYLLWRGHTGQVSPAHLDTSSHKQQPKHTPLIILLSAFAQSSKICYQYAAYIKTALFNTASQLFWLLRAKAKMYLVSGKSVWSAVTNKHAGRALAFITGTTRYSPHAKGQIYEDRISLIIIHNSYSHVDSKLLMFTVPG